MQTALPSARLEWPSDRVNVGRPCEAEGLKDWQGRRGGCVKSQETGPTLVIGLRRPRAAGN
jgi:hypothetical protein